VRRIRCKFLRHFLGDSQHDVVGQTQTARDRTLRRDSTSPYTCRRRAALCCISATQIQHRAGGKAELSACGGSSIGAHAALAKTSPAGGYVCSCLQACHPQQAPFLTRSSLAVLPDVVEVLHACAGAAQQRSCAMNRGSEFELCPIDMQIISCTGTCKSAQQSAAEHATTHQSPVLRAQMEPDLHWKRSQSCSRCSAIVSYGVLRAFLDNQNLQHFSLSADVADIDHRTSPWTNMQDAAASAHDCAECQLACHLAR